MADAQSRPIGKFKAELKHEEAPAAPIRIAQLTQTPSRPQPPLRPRLVDPLFDGLADEPESTRVPSDITIKPLPSQLEKVLEANDLIPQIAQYRQEYVELRAMSRRQRLRRMLEKLDTNPRSKSAYAKLEQVIDFPFKAETPLEEAIAYLEETTKGPDDKGLTFYIDIVGPSETDKMPSSLVSLDLEEVPVRFGLELNLKQLGLTFYVEEGVVVITTETSDAAGPNGYRQRILRKMPLEDANK